MKSTTYTHTHYTFIKKNEMENITEKETKTPHSSQV